MLQQLPALPPLIAKRGYSKVSVWITFSIACSGGIIVIQSCNTLVTDVAEFIFALSAHKQILSISLCVDRLTLWTSCAELQVDERISLITQILLHHFFSDIVWDDIESLFYALRALFEMHGAFRWLSASPAQIVPTLYALNVGAATGFMG